MNGMTRRKMFSFLPLAPIAAAAPVLLTPEPAAPAVPASGMVVDSNVKGGLRLVNCSNVTIMNNVFETLDDDDPHPVRIILGSDDDD